LPTGGCAKTWLKQTWNFANEAEPI
jgi:hypothetical protein